MVLLASGSPKCTICFCIFLTKPAWDRSNSPTQWLRGHYLFATSLLSLKEKACSASDLAITLVRKTLRSCTPVRWLPLIQLSIYTDILTTLDVGNGNKTAVWRDQPLNPPPYPPLALKWKKQKRRFIWSWDPRLQNGEKDYFKNCGLQDHLQTPLCTGSQNHTWMERSFAWRWRKQNGWIIRWLGFVVTAHFE